MESQDEATLGREGLKVLTAYTVLSSKVNLNQVIKYEPNSRIITKNSAEMK